MTGDMKRLLRELDLPEGCPTADAKAVKRRVNAALNADPSERKAYMRQKMKFAAVLVAAVVALTGTALAVGPTLQELVNNLLGSYAPYAQEVAGAAATDQGIEIKVISAVADHVNAKIILGVRDLKVSRILDDNLSLRVDIRRELVEPAGWGWWTQPIGYDSETHTALYQVDFSGMHKLTDSPFTDAPITLDISSVQPGYHRVSVLEFPTEFTALGSVDSKLLDSGEQVLIPGLSPAELGDAEGISLSSIGFASDGYLHIQLQMPEKTIGENHMVGFYMDTDNDFEHQKRYNNETSVFFHEGKRPYLDLRYDITRADVGDFKIRELYGSFLTEKAIKGEWKLTVPLKELPIRTITVNQPIGGTMVRTISMTAISASAETELIPDVKPHFGVPGLPLALYLKDGTMKHANDEWNFDVAINPNDVTAIAIGMWYIPLEGDNALPGHWLSELPQ